MLHLMQLIEKIVVHSVTSCFLRYAVWDGKNIKYQQADAGMLNQIEDEDHFMRATTVRLIAYRFLDLRLAAQADPRPVGGHSEVEKKSFFF